MACRRKKDIVFDDFPNYIYLFFPSNIWCWRLHISFIVYRFSLPMMTPQKWSSLSTSPWWVSKKFPIWQAIEFDKKSSAGSRLLQVGTHHRTRLHGPWNLGTIPLWKNHQIFLIGRNKEYSPVRRVVYQWHCFAHITFCLVPYGSITVICFHARQRWWMVASSWFRFVRSFGQTWRNVIAGWWFGTFLIFPFSWECHHPNWRTHIFQRGWNNQPEYNVWGPHGPTALIN